MLVAETCAPFAPGEEEAMLRELSDDLRRSDLAQPARTAETSGRRAKCVTNRAQVGQAAAGKSEVGTRRSEKSPGQQTQADAKCVTNRAQVGQGKAGKSEVGTRKSEKSPVPQTQADAKCGTNRAQVGQATAEQQEKPKAEQQEKPAADYLLDKYRDGVVADLLLGTSVANVARKLDVSRRTIHRWLAKPEVAAELQRRQQEISAGYRNHVASWANRAMEVLESSLNAGDLNAAVGLLKGVGLLSGAPMTAADDLLLPAKTAEETAPVAGAPASCDLADSASSGQPQSGGAAVAGGNAGGKQTEVSHVPSLPGPASRCDLDPPYAEDGRPGLEDLPLQQQQVIARLLAGDQPMVAAQQVQISYRLLQRWLQADSAFRQVLRTCRAELQAEMQVRLTWLIPQALAVVERALQQGNSRIALIILRGLGLCRKQGLEGVKFQMTE